MPPDAARATLVALLPLAPMHAEFGRHLLLMLRKALVAPEPRARSFAVHAFCALLASRTLADNAAAQVHRYCHSPSPRPLSIATSAKYGG